jgi:hypothetical protein
MHPDGKAIAPSLHSYSFELHTKSLTQGSQTYTYVDFAKASRRCPRLETFTHTHAL